jgi:hypothetical protein
MASKKKHNEDQVETDDEVRDVPEQSVGEEQPTQDEATKEADPAEGVEEVDEFDGVKTLDMVTELDQLDEKIDELRARRAKVSIAINRRLKRRR